MNIIQTIFTLGDVDIIENIKRLPSEYYYLEHGGRVYNTLEEIGSGKLIQLHFRMCGGKGGFGSLLRSFRIHRSTNQLMCRNLSGRRLADIKEEERLQKWIEKKEEREEIKKKKKEEKYERLRRGAAKHEFKDQKYLRSRDRIMDQTEDAVEAGMKALGEGHSRIDLVDLRLDKTVLLSDGEDMRSSSSSSSSDDSTFNVCAAALEPPSTSQKRNNKTKVSKKLKVEYTSELIYEYFTEQIIEEVALLAIMSEQKAQESRKRKAEEELAEKKKNSKRKKHAQSTSNGTNDFPVVDLKEYKSIEELEKLGLVCLKSALEARGLKCGGSLHERAARLFSVKGLRECEYPKNIVIKKKF